MNKNAIVAYNVSLDLGRRIEALIYKRFKRETTATPSVSNPGVYDVVFDGEIESTLYDIILVYVAGIVDSFTY